MIKRSEPGARAHATERGSADPAITKELRETLKLAQTLQSFVNVRFKEAADAHARTRRALTDLRAKHTRLHTEHERLLRAFQTLHTPDAMWTLLFGVVTSGAGGAGIVPAALRPGLVELACQAVVVAPSASTFCVPLVLRALLRADARADHARALSAVEAALLVPPPPQPGLVAWWFGLMGVVLDLDRAGASLSDDLAEVVVLIVTKALRSGQEQFRAAAAVDFSVGISDVVEAGMQLIRRWLIFCARTPGRARRAKESAPALREWAKMSAEMLMQQLSPFNPIAMKAGETWFKMNMLIDQLVSKSTRVPNPPP